MKRTRKKKNEVIQNAHWGAYALILIVLVIGVVAYFADCFESNWRNVFELVVIPFSLRFGFLAYERAYESLWDYKDSKKEDDD